MIKYLFVVVAIEKSEYIIGRTNLRGGNACPRCAVGATSKVRGDIGTVDQSTARLVHISTERIAPSQQ